MRSVLALDVYAVNGINDAVLHLIEPLRASRQWDLLLGLWSYLQLLISADSEVALVLGVLRP